jgi:hypothetical protein
MTATQPHVRRDWTRTAYTVAGIFCWLLVIHAALSDRDFGRATFFLVLALYLGVFDD